MPSDATSVLCDRLFGISMAEDCSCLHVYTALKSGVAISCSYLMQVCTLKALLDTLVGIRCRNHVAHLQQACCGLLHSLLALQQNQPGSERWLPSAVFDSMAPKVSQHTCLALKTTVWQALMHLDWLLTHVTRQLSV